MNYMGGKFRQGPIIAEHVVRRMCTEDRYHYVEPFCGALGVASIVADRMRETDATIELSDANGHLITTWRAGVFDGWEPPRTFTEDDYRAVSAVRDPNDPITAYAGFALSFGGKWFAGFTRQNGRRDYTRWAYTSTMRKILALRNIRERVTIECRRYESYVCANPSGSVIYLDPPYADRTRTAGHIAFDSEAFWEFARRLRASNASVCVTEFVAPPDFTKIHNFGNTIVRHHKGKPVDDSTEGIFV